jgi:catechol 2,3-dioxygenase-like lactoylglutathione lyase family enzyme
VLNVGRHPLTMHLRVARHTERIDELVAFYRDGLGLELSGTFAGHDGYSGVFLAIPGTGAHLEFTSGSSSTVSVPHPESLLVFYLDDPAKVAATVERTGVTPINAENPYWERIGAVTLRDPDGFLVVLVPTPWT